MSADSRDLLIAELMDALTAAHDGLKRFHDITDRTNDVDDNVIDTIHEESNRILTDSPTEGAIRELQAASISRFIEDMKITAERMRLDEFQMGLMARIIDETLQPPMIVAP